MRRKKEQEEEGGSERWLVSYADFITLLFAFFTTLYAISTVDAQKMGQMVSSMRASFDSNMFEPGSRTLTLNPPGGNGSSSEAILKSVDLSGTKLKELKSSSAKRHLLKSASDMAQFKKAVETLMSADVGKGMVRIHLENRGVIISLGEAGLYDSGSDEIKPGGKDLLNKLGATLVNLENQIRVEGHTDNVPIRNSRFPSNWELSTSRASGMLRYMVESLQFRPELLSPAGYAEYRPAATNDTEEGRSLNRRVDIVVLNPAAAQSEPQ